MTKELQKKYIAHLNQYLVGRKIEKLNFDPQGKIESLIFDDDKTVNVRELLRPRRNTDMGELQNGVPRGGA